MMAFAIPKVAETMIGDKTFGKMWRVMIREFFVPMERAERTNSRSFNAKTSPYNPRRRHPTGDANRRHDQNENTSFRPKCPV